MKKFVNKAEPEQKCLFLAYHKSDNESFQTPFTLSSYSTLQGDTGIFTVHDKSFQEDSKKAGMGGAGEENAN